jgi:type I restriction enzyme S subunit
MEMTPVSQRPARRVCPETWKSVILGDLTTKIGSGITPRGGSSNYLEYGRPFVRSQNVGWGNLLLDDLVYIDEETHRSFSATELEAGDVLLNITGASIGRTAVVSDSLFGGNVNQHVCIIRVDQAHTIPQFINYVLLSSLGQKQIDSFQAGGNRQGLNFSQVRSIKIDLPPTRAEQEAIAEALSDADALIESLEQLLTKKRQIKQGAMQELLTGKRRLPGFKGEWVARKFGTLAQVRNNKINTYQAPLAEFCIELEQIGQGTSRLLGYSDARDRIAIKYTFQAGDTLFGRLRPYLRKFWSANRNGVCSTEIWPLIPKGAELDATFLAQIVKTEGFVDAASSSYGTHMPRSDWKALSEYEILLPVETNEQRAIAFALSDIDAEIVTLEEKLTKAKALKQGMMQELLTGRIRLV